MRKFAIRYILHIQESAFRPQFSVFTSLFWVLGTPKCKIHISLWPEVPRLSDWYDMERDLSYNCFEPNHFQLPLVKVPFLIFLKKCAVLAAIGGGPLLRGGGFQPYFWEIYRLFFFFFFERRTCSFTWYTLFWVKYYKFSCYSQNSKKKKKRAVLPSATIVYSHGG